MSKFITFEGGEGVGKSTQAKMLCKFFEDKGEKVFLTREPGGTVLAEKIRNEILLKNNGVDDPLTEFLLLSAARRDHVESIIKPKLKQGVFVVCDRFYDSSVAYQAYYKGLDFSIMEQINNLAINDFKPDITFLLELDHKKANIRVSDRGVGNHYDKKGGGFAEIITDAFAEIANKNKDRIIKINATGSINIVFERIKGHILKMG